MDFWWIRNDTCFLGVIFPTQNCWAPQLSHPTVDHSTGIYPLLDKRWEHEPTYPLVNVYIAMENIGKSPFSWENPLFRLGHVQ